MRIFFVLTFCTFVLQLFNNGAFAYYSDFAKTKASPNINKPKIQLDDEATMPASNNTEASFDQNKEYVITKNLQNKIDRSSGFRGGVGGYLSFDKKAYTQDKNQDKNQEQNQTNARRRFSFVNPNKYGSLNYANDSLKNKKNINNRRFLDTNNYNAISYSSSINTTLKSDKQYGGQNQNSSPLSKSYGFSFAFAQQLFNNVNENKQKLNTYDAVNRNALNKGLRTNRLSKVKIWNKYSNFKKSVRNSLGDDLLFAEYSLNLTLNEFRGNPAIKNSAPVNKSLSGLYGSVKILYMPKFFNRNITFSKNIVIPTQIFFFPEFGYGYFGYKNILNFDQTTVNQQTNSIPKDTVIKQSFLKPIYGFGIGSFFDISTLLKSQKTVITRVDLKYLQTPSMSVVSSNSSYNENLKYSNLSINYSLIFAF